MNHTFNRAVAWSVRGYAVVWCVTLAGKRVKSREDFVVEDWGWPGNAQNEAQIRAAELRASGFAACVEVIR